MKRVGMVFINGKEIMFRVAVDRREYVDFFYVEAKNLLAGLLLVNLNQQTDELNRRLWIDSKFYPERIHGVYEIQC